MTGNSVRAVLFDMDGTLLDSRAAIIEAYRRCTAALLPKPLTGDDPRLDRILQLRARESFLELSGGDPALSERLAEEFQRVYAELEPSITLFEGAAHTLVRLRKRGLRLGIVTTKARQRLDMHLNAERMHELLDVTVAGEDTARNKPDPLPIRVALERIGIEPRHALYVGDGPNDVLAAQAAGVRVVGVGWGFHPNECLAAAPELWVNSWTELADVALGLLESERRNRCRNCCTP